MGDSPIAIIVENSSDLAALAALTLKSLGFQSVCYASMEVALEDVPNLRVPVTLAVIDLDLGERKMNGADGILALRQASPETWNMVCLLWTGDNKGETEARRVGAAFVRKGFPDDLAEAIRRAMQVDTFHSANSTDESLN